MKYEKISNPLTIIAIFAGLAEIAGTTSLAIVNDSLQIYFLWFVMGFPTLLLLLFFWTLHKDPTKLYSPGDYQDDKSFLESLSQGYFETKPIEDQSEKHSSKDIGILEKVVEVLPEKVIRILLEASSKGNNEVNAFEKVFKVGSGSEGIKQGFVFGIVKSLPFIARAYRNDSGERIVSFVSDEIQEMLTRRIT